MEVHIGSLSASGDNVYVYVYVHYLTNRHKTGEVSIMVIASS